MVIRGLLELRLLVRIWRWLICGFCVGLIYMLVVRQ